MGENGMGVAFLAFPCCCESQALVIWRLSDGFQPSDCCLGAGLFELIEVKHFHTRWAHVSSIV
jgi:hypothetical protein